VPSALSQWLNPRAGRPGPRRGGRP
jgi:hypothetical protein